MAGDVVILRKAKLEAVPTPAAPKKPGGGSAKPDRRGPRPRDAGHVEPIPTRVR